jgi:hypothetical protein
MVPVSRRTRTVVIFIYDLPKYGQTISSRPALEEAAVNGVG